MFSRRTQWNLEENRLTRLLREKRRQGVPLADFTEANPTRCGFSASAAVLELLSRPGSRFYNPDPKGALSAREAIAGYYAEQSIRVSPEQILLTSGTSEAYAHLFQLLCDPGDSIITLHPSYPLFEHLAQLSDISLVSVALRYDGEWHIDPEELRATVSDTSRGMILVHPHSPTGMLLKEAARLQMESILLQHGCPIIADEVFSSYRHVNDTHAVRSFADSDSILTFTLNGLSKLAGFPQLKLGWIVVSGPATLQQEALKRLEMISDTFLSVSAPVQLALPEILSALPSLTGPILERVLENIGVLQKSVEGTPVSLLRPQGGWNAVLRMPAVLSDEDWCLQFLENENVIVHPGYFFDFRGGEFVVLSLLPETPEFEQGINRLMSAVSRIVLA